MRPLTLWLGPAPEPGAHLLRHGSAETGRWLDGAAGGHVLLAWAGGCATCLCSCELRPAVSYEVSFPEPVFMLQDACRLGTEAAKSSLQAPCLHASLSGNAFLYMHVLGEGVSGLFISPCTSMTSVRARL